MTASTNVCFLMGSLSHASCAAVAIKAAELALPHFESAYPNEHSISRVLEASKAQYENKSDDNKLDLFYASNEAQALLGEMSVDMTNLTVNHAMYSVFSACAYIAADNKDDFKTASLDAVSFAIKVDEKIESELVDYINVNQLS
jgi:hypothetical protein